MALTHDDYVDAIFAAVANFQRAMMMDVDQAAKAMKDAEIEDFIEVCGSMASGWLRGQGTAGLMWSGANEPLRSYEASSPSV